MVFGRRFAQRLTDPNLIRSKFFEGRRKKLFFSSVGAQYGILGFCVWHFGGKNHLLFCAFLLDILNKKTQIIRHLCATNEGYNAT